MPAGTDLIFFNNPSDWRVIADITRRAIRVGEKSYKPIPAFNLGLSLQTDYVAVVATTSSGKPTWQLAGNINQVYSFALGGTSSITGKIQPVRTRLFLNKLTLIETNRVSTDRFDLEYQPPYWFKDCAIRVYQYTGEKLNFVEDSLFQIGNALGVDSNQPEGKIIKALSALKLDIEARLTEINETIDNTDAANEQAQLQLIEQMNRQNAGIYSLSEGLAELLPGDRGEQMRARTQNRLSLDLGFL